MCSNHLGNVLSTVSDKKVGADEDGNGLVDFYHSQILSTQAYYPFGWQINSKSYRYKSMRFDFNDKETDRELTDWQNYGERMYMKREVRFISVDPLNSKYPNLSAYQFAANRPIDGVDIDGMEHGAAMSNYRDWVSGDSEIKVENAGKVKNRVSWSEAMEGYGEFYGDIGSWSYENIFAPGALMGRADPANTGGPLGGEEGFEAVSDVGEGLGGMGASLFFAPETGFTSTMGLTFSTDKFLGGLSKLQDLYSQGNISKGTHEPLKYSVEQGSKILTGSKTSGSLLYESAGLGLGGKGLIKGSNLLFQGKKVQGVYESVSGGYGIYSSSQNIVDEVSTSQTKDKHEN